MIVIWLAALIIFVVVEAVTYALVSIWFAAGALAAIAATALGAPIWLQVVLFLAVSAAALGLTRPLAKRWQNKAKPRTNADMALGREAVVTETIDNLAGTGQVSVEGKLWTARSTDGTRIETGALVKTERIEGVKLFVTPGVTTAPERREEN